MWLQHVSREWGGAYNTASRIYILLREERSPRARTRHFIRCARSFVHACTRELMPTHVYTIYILPLAFSQPPTHSSSLDLLLPKSLLSLSLSSVVPSLVFLYILDRYIYVTCIIAMLWLLAICPLLLARICLNRAASYTCICFLFIDWRERLLYSTHLYIYGGSLWISACDDRLNDLRDIYASVGKTTRTMMMMINETANSVLFSSSSSGEG